MAPPRRAGRARPASTNSSGTNASWVGTVKPSGTSKRTSIAIAKTSTHEAAGPSANAEGASIIHSAATAGDEASADEALGQALLARHGGAGPLETPRPAVAALPRSPRRTSSSRESTGRRAPLSRPRGQGRGPNVRPDSRKSLCPVCHRPMRAGATNTDQGKPGANRGRKARGLAGGEIARLPVPPRKVSMSQPIRVESPWAGGRPRMPRRRPGAGPGR
jgi:hypothetical protein